jgi:hypothetical protein
LLGLVSAIHLLTPSQPRFGRSASKYIAEEKESLRKMAGDVIAVALAAAGYGFLAYLLFFESVWSGWMVAAAGTVGARRALAG